MANPVVVKPRTRHTTPDQTGETWVTAWSTADIVRQTSDTGSEILFMADMHPSWPDLAGRLVGDRHVLPVRVYYEDTDFSGVAYHGAYVRFLERGRSDFLRLLGVHQGALHGSDSVAFAVRSMTLDFPRAARIDDVLEVTTMVDEVGGATVTLGQRIARGDEVIVAASVRVALVGDGRPRRLPASLRQAFLSLKAASADDPPSS
jgi:acyl-CoA thioester hydrolase